MEERNLVNTNKSEFTHSVDTHDRISSLPNDVLHHIFADVQTKELVQSSVLSKRWVNLWTSTPYLNFDQSKLMTTHAPAWKFMQLISMTLLSLQDGLTLRRLRILGVKRLDWETVCSWIRFACHLNVRDINLDITPDIESPVFYGTQLELGESIVVLKLNLNFHKMPISMNCGGLKTIHLVSILLPNTEYVSKIFERCPLIENFSMERCLAEHSTVMKISASNLKDLTLVYNGDLFADVLEVFAPKLVSFVYIGDPLRDWHLENLCSLERVSVRFTCLFEDTDHILCKMVNGFYHARIIQLSFSIFQYGPRVDCTYFHREFNNIKQLYLHAHFHSCTIGMIIHLLKHIPNLETLEIDTEESYGGEPLIDDQWPWFQGFSCLSNIHLKKLEIINSHGTDLELEFIELILACGKALEEVVIYWNDDGGVFNNIVNIFEFPKASPNVSISFPVYKEQKPFWYKYWLLG